MAAVPLTWDPTVLGPMDRCVNCFSERGMDSVICPNCGYTSGVHVVSDCIDGVRCQRHPESVARAFCNWCADPICDECIEREGFNFPWSSPLIYCKKCVALAEQIERDFRERVSRLGTCAKHDLNRATFTCSQCSLPLCDSCAYFVTAGLFRRRIMAGAFCLICFRLNTVGGGRKRWINADTAQRLDLLRASKL